MHRKLRNTYACFMVLILGLTLSPSDGYAWYFVKRADFTTVVFVGDSLTAGFQNGSLYKEGQINGYAAQIADQAGFDIKLPLVSDDGIPPRFIINPYTLEIEQMTEGGAASMISSKPPTWPYPDTP